MFCIYKIIIDLEEKLRLKMATVAKSRENVPLIVADASARSIRR